MKARASLTELQMSALTGTDEDKDGAWHLERAAELVRLHQETRQAAGGDGSQKLPDTGIAAANGSPIYNLDRMMLSVYESVQEHGAAFDLDKLSGSPEAEMTKDYAATPFAKGALAELNREARPGQRVVPIPSACLRPDIMRLAETYAGAVTANQEAREPTFRRDQLIDHFRPISRMEFLGVMMETIANDQSLPRVTGAHSAGWKSGDGERGRGGDHTLNPDDRAAPADRLRRRVLAAPGRCGFAVRHHPGRFQRDDAREQFRQRKGRVPRHRRKPRAARHLCHNRRPRWRDRRCCWQHDAVTYGEILGHDHRYRRRRHPG